MHNPTGDATTALPASFDFQVGQDRTGRWLAVETRGLRGGFFASRDAALDYARAETDGRPGAVRLMAEHISFR